MTIEELQNGIAAGLQATAQLRDCLPPPLEPLRHLVPIDDVQITVTLRRPGTGPNEKGQPIDKSAPAHLFDPRRDVVEITFRAPDGTQSTVEPGRHGGAALSASDEPGPRDMNGVPDRRELEFEPVTIHGEPLSETILRERR